MAKKKSKKKKANKNIVSKLKALQKKWKKSAPKRFGKQAPDGDYEARIVGANLDVSKNGNLMLVWTLKIISGKFEGREVTKRANLEGESSLDYVQGDLDLLDLTIPDDIEDIGETALEAIGTDLQITLRSADGFQNIDFNDLLEPEDDDEGEEEEDEDEEDDDEDEEDEDEEDEEDEEEDEEEDDFPSDAEIRKMKKADLLELIEEFELDIEDPDDLSVKDLRSAVIEVGAEDEEEDED